MKSYHSVIDYLAELAPDIELNPRKFISWAEDICDLLSNIYNKEYDDVTFDLYTAAKELQGIGDVTFDLYTSAKELQGIEDEEGLGV